MNATISDRWRSAWRWLPLRRASGTPRLQATITPQSQRRKFFHDITVYLARRGIQINGTPFLVGGVWFVNADGISVRLSEALSMEITGA